MNSSLESKPQQHTLHQKLREAFTPTYLTILSIIQAVALTDLATVVTAEYRQFTVVRWLLALLTFCVLIIVWNVYTIQSIIWDWIPDVRDAAMPFVVGSLELFLNHTIIPSMSFWLLGVAGIATMGTLGTGHMHWRVRTEAQHTQLLSHLKRYHLLFALYYAGGAVLLLVLAWTSHIGGLEAIERVQGVQEVLAVGIVLFVGVCLGGAVCISHLYWRKSIMYARSHHADVSS